MTIHSSDSLAGQAIDTAVASTSLNALGGAGSIALGAAINNVPTDGSTIAFPVGDLTIRLSSAVTTGAGAPSIQVWILPQVDGTNYADPSPALSYTFQFTASTSYQTLVCPNLPLFPYNFKVQIGNSLGVALPATNTSTCQLQRKTGASW